MRIYKTLIASVMLGVLSSCATLGHMDAPQTVYAVEGSYAAALRLAVAYRQLPSCVPQGHPVLCHDPAVVKTLIAANNRAYTAMHSAETLIAAHGTAQQIAAAIAVAKAEIADFQSSVPTR